ncbi:MAG: VWA domain-containing protein [Fimbriimonadaceae bacterium]|nr:VWA domain-containing protein [Fimbriimonadaceae bacterium]QYK56915.1 MAG: VWA domain-containing protein [Fimbriimonadaceae bacterium]
MSQVPPDPNKTQMTGFDPNKTVLGGGPDPNRTVAISAPPASGDPNRTTAWTPPSTELNVVATPSRKAAMANGPAREQFLVEITAPGDAALPGMVSGGQRTPVNLCLVVDRSGSMEGPPLEYAKQACNYVVDLLGPNDVLSIVVFDEIVEVLMAPQRVTNRQAVKDGIAQLRPGYTTNISDALTLASQQLAQFGGETGRATRLVMLTDGEPTAGIKDFSSLVQLAGDMKGRGVTSTFLGFGAEYNEELLASMAKRSGGNYYYIPQPQLIPEIFRTELEKLMTTAVTGLKLSLKLARWVNLRAATGMSVVPDQREFTVEMADLERGATLQQVFDFEFPNHPLGHYRVAGGKLTYADGGGQKSVDVDLVMEFTADAARYSAPVDPRVSSAFEVSAAGRAVERTIMGLKTQAITSAVAVADLQKTQALLLSQGRVQEAQEVTIAMQAIQRGDTGGAEKTLMGTMVNLDQGKTRG